MVPIYPAIILEEDDLPGGSTKPLLVNADTGDGLNLFVVKVFSPRQQEQYSPLAMELYGNLLAKEFDIIVPDAALISFDRQFIETLPEDIRIRAQAADAPFHFATKYHKGYTQYVAGTHKRTFDTYDVENIFAFDVLTRNIDRRVGKPNLLIKGRNYLAIDHELSLCISKTFAEYYNNHDYNFIRSNDPLRKHIFYQRLFRIRQSIEFYTFAEYLKNVNLDCVINAAEFLQSLHLPTGDIERINPYLYEIRKNGNKFIQLCKYLIS